MLSTESLPLWIWFLYYLLLLMTLIGASQMVVRRRHRVFSAGAVLLSIVLPISGFFQAIERPLLQNEFEFFAAQLMNGSYLSIFLLAGTVYLAGWWLVYTKENRVKRVQPELEEDHRNAL